MAHLRERYLLPRLRKTLSQVASVSLLGMRQTGKTTLLKQIAASYFTLDDDLTLASFREGHWSALEHAAPPVALDECQKLPGIFDRVKLFVDQKKQLGRFLLTGSVRFLSKRQIKESLTGRTLTLELLPLTIAEAHQKKSQNFIALVRKSKTLEELSKCYSRDGRITLTQIHEFLVTGGLPGICFKRDHALRDSLLEQQLETLLGRDLQFLYQSRVSVTVLKEILKLVALGTSQPVVAAQIARKVRVSRPTIMALLKAFEDLFILRSQKNRYYFEDGGIQNFILKNEFLSRQQLFQTFIFRELTALIKYEMGAGTELKFYATRGGVDIPFIVYVDQSPTVALTFDADLSVSEKSLKSLNKYKKSHKNTHSIALYLGEKAYVASNGVWCVPLTWIG